MHNKIQTNAEITSTMEEVVSFTMMQSKGPHKNSPIQWYAAYTGRDGSIHNDHLSKNKALATERAQRMLENGVFGWSCYTTDDGEFHVYKTVGMKRHHETETYYSVVYPTPSQAIQSKYETKQRELVRQYDRAMEKHLHD